MEQRGRRKKEIAFRYMIKCRTLLSSLAEEAEADRVPMLMKCCYIDKPLYNAYYKKLCLVEGNSESAFVSEEGNELDGIVFSWRGLLMYYIQSKKLVFRALPSRW